MVHPACSQAKATGDGCRERAGKTGHYYTAVKIFTTHFHAPASSRLLTTIILPLIVVLWRDFQWLHYLLHLHQQWVLPPAVSPSPPVLYSKDRLLEIIWVSLTGWIPIGGLGSWKRGQGCPYHIFVLWHNLDLSRTLEVSANGPPFIVPVFPALE